jgi:hypothetical protein
LLTPTYRTFPCCMTFWSPSSCSAKPTGGGLLSYADGVKSGIPNKDPTYRSFLSRRGKSEAK